MHILLDHNMPHGLVGLLAGHRVETAADLGWAKFANGDLMDAAETLRFDLMLTADRNLRHQQRLVGRTLAIVVLSTNAWPVLRRHAAPILKAVGRAGGGSYEEVSLPRGG